MKLSWLEAAAERGLERVVEWKRREENVGRFVRREKEREWDLGKKGRGVWALGFLERREGGEED